MPRQSEAATMMQIARYLKREGQSRPGHAEVVMGTLDKIPAEVSHPANVSGESDLQTGADLTSKSALVFCGSETEHAFFRINSPGLVIMASKHTTDAAPNVGRETRTMNGI